MKKFLIITGCIITVMAVLSCNRARRNTGRAYMPDMVYSVAYETYAPVEERLSKYGAHYNNQPVAGTIARGDMFPYTLKNDTVGYAQSASVVNPISLLDAKLDSKDFLEASRLYLVNCGICHGSKLDGNGPLYNDGKGPFSSAPKNFMADDMKALPEGKMFHSVTYGKGQMGSYASQLSTKQRWMIISYIREKQKAAATPASNAGTDSTGAKKTAGDSTSTTKK
jgi:mono/diheme cytochrome c family protein